MNEQYNNQQHILTRRPNRIFSYLVVIMMLGNVYLFPFFKSLDMGEIIMMVFIPYFVLNMSSFSIKREYSLIYVFVVYSLLVTLFMSVVLNVNISDPTVRMIRDFFYYFVIFFLGTHFFDMSTFKKVLIRFCILLSAFVILQVIVYTFMGYLIPGFLMGASLNDGGYTGAQLYSNYIIYANIAGYLKPNGFLCEPAHCAQCFFVAILVLLFGNNKEKNDIKWAVFISIGTTLTMSTSAMLYLMFAWGAWCFKESKKNFLRIIVIIFFVIVLMAIAIKNGYLDNVMVVIQRFTKTITGDNVTNSSQLRMIKGFTTFLALPLLQKIFGIGFGNYAAIVPLIGNSSVINMVDNEYMNTISYILVSAGAIGFIIMCKFFVQLFRQNSGLGRIMIIALVFVSFGSSIYSSPIWIWMMLVILYSGRRGDEIKWRMY